MGRISYQEATIPAPWQILGLRLKPLCLGHWLHMARFNVAFVSTGEAEAKYGDVVMAALICSMTYDGFLEFIQEPDWKEEMKAWGARIGEFDLAEKVKLINRYITEGTRQPAVFFEGKTRDSGAHWCQVLKVALLNIGYSEVRAMNMPLTEAVADFYRDAEAKGILTIADPDLAELLDGEAAAAASAPDPEVANG